MNPLKCNHCNHEWNYKGNSDYYVTCPRCYKKVNISIKKEKKKK